MNHKLRKKLARRKRRIERRLDKWNNSGCERPMITAANIHYEIADRTRGISAGGIGGMHLMVKRLGLVEAIDRRLQLFKFHMPYHESDHVLTSRTTCWPAERAWSTSNCGATTKRISTHLARGGFPTRRRPAISADASTNATSTGCRTCSTRRG